MTAPPTDDVHGLAASLVPALREETGGRLGDVEWFRSSWQRGGAATAFSTWRADGGAAIPAMVKLPVGPIEYAWTTRLGASPEEWDSPASRALPTPRVLSMGRTLGPYDLSWLIVERLDGRTLASNWDAGAIAELLTTVAEMQALAARLVPGIGPRAPVNWEAALHQSRDAIRTYALPEAQRWNEAVRGVQRSLPRLATRWEHRSINAWCHGDVHPGNAMRRISVPGQAAACVLIDLALVHAGHWIEDALYLERQYWGHADQLHGVKPVSMLAKLRRERGLDASDDYGGLANVRRVLAAACAPALAGREGNAKYLHAALTTIDSLLPLAAR